MNLIFDQSDFPEDELEKIINGLVEAQQHARHGVSGERAGPGGR